MAKKMTAMTIKSNKRLQNEWWERNTWLPGNGVEQQLLQWRSCAFTSIPIKIDLERMYSDLICIRFLSLSSCSSAWIGVTAIHRACYCCIVNENLYSARCTVSRCHTTSVCVSRCKMIDNNRANWFPFFLLLICIRTSCCASDENKAQHWQLHKLKSASESAKQNLNYRYNSIASRIRTTFRLVVNWCALIPIIYSIGIGFMAPTTSRNQQNRFAVQLTCGRRKLAWISTPKRGWLIWNWIVTRSYVTDAPR